ncbi:hormone-sensitive lipase [Sarotherodon galilaeus]
MGTTTPRRVNQDSPTTSRAFRNSGRTSSTPGALPPRSCLTASVTSTPEIGGSFPSSPDSASSSEDVSVGLRRSSKYSFHRLTIFSVDVSSAPPALYTVQVEHRFPLLRRLTVCQNLFEAVRKSFSMASPNSSHTRVFASATARAAFRLACRYLSAASGVPQANQAR